MLYAVLKRLVLVIACILPAGICALSVSPTLLSLSENQPVTTLTVTNDKDYPVVLQLQLNKWQQSDMQEKLSLSQDLIVTPLFLLSQPTKAKLFVLVWIILNF